MWTWKKYSGHAPIHETSAASRVAGTIRAPMRSIGRRCSDPDSPDTGDDNIWRAHFGQSAASGATAGGSAFAVANLPASAAVPEPTTLILLLFAATRIMSLGVRRRGLVVSNVPA
jgi:hypothetical protein